MCATEFPGGERFGYELATASDVAATTTTTANFAGGTVKVTLAKAQAQLWALTETEVSIAVAAPVEGDSLALLIEKDFECLDPREGEDQSNRFKNPKAG